MKKFKIDEKVFEKVPKYIVGIVVAQNIDNSEINNKALQMLQEETKIFSEKQYEIRQMQSVKAYRDAFLKFDINPNRFMCSIEALLKRVQKGGNLPNINTIVNIGNAISVKHKVPIGSHDMDKANDLLEIRLATNNDSFLGMGESEKEIVPTGELVYVSGNIVKTRRWMWRQSDDGKITENTKNVFFPIDGFKDINEKDVILARNELAEFLKTEYPSAKITCSFADITNNEIVIE